MHTSGLLTTASTVTDLDEMVQSAAVVFSSPSRARLEKHFKNLQPLMQKTGIEVNVTTKSKSNTEDLKVNVPPGCIRTFTLTFLERCEVLECGNILGCI